MGLGTDGLELAIEDPMSAPGVKHVGRDDDVSGLLLLHPEGCDSGLIPGAGDRLSDDEDGCLRHATGNEGAAGEVRGFGRETQKVCGARPLIGNEDERGDSGVVELCGFVRPKLLAPA